MATTNITGVQAIHDLVREGRATPDDGALLLEIRGEVDAGRDRIAIRHNPLAQLAVLLGVFVLAFLGIKRNS